MSDYRPYLVSWNLTKRCNLLCPHCYIDAGSETAGELTRQEARFVIDELSYLDTPLMLVLSGGEPMLREDIFEIVEYASRAGFITVMGSNGTLLIEENIRMLKDAGLMGMGISIDSATPAYHDTFRGSNGAWQLSVSALRYAREAGIETQLDATLTDQNYNEVNGLIELGVKLGAKAVNFFFLVCTGRAMKTDIFIENYNAVLKQIAKISMKERRLMVRARCAPHIYRVFYEEGFPIYEGMRGCLAGRSYMRIDPEGNITPCPYMSVKVGDIRETSITDIWNDSPYLRLMRDGNYKGRCGLCEFTEICGGCRARALMEKGDFMEEDSLCTYKLTGREKVTLNGNLKTRLLWDEKAKERIKKVPIFMKGVVIRIIEARAIEEGIDCITSEFIDRLKMKVSPDIHRNFRN
ncbi:MAG: putative heme d1 biosynthesis radical SAM protein NirJ2 [Thermodesulfovibrionales bacterium]